MSFFEDNKHFINNGFRSLMRGMSLEERQVYYNANLKLETRNRLKQYYEKLKEQIIEVKIQFYQEIVGFFIEYEYEIIIYSIYFEKKNQQILNAIITQLQQKTLGNNSKLYLIQNFLDSNTFEFQNQFKNVLGEKLKLTNNDWIQKDDSVNSIINKLNRWLQEKLIENNSEEEIKLVLFHYSKLWQLEYSTPVYKERLGIIMLDKFSTSLKNISSNLKVDLNEILCKIDSILNSLFFEIPLPPYLESITTSNNRRNPIINGYIVKVKVFQSILIDIKKYLINYNKLSIQDLVTLYSMSSIEVQKNIFTEIQKRLITNYLPTKPDIDFFINQKRILEQNDSQKLVNSFCRSNYLFYLS